MADQKKKQVIAVSRAMYRGYAILEVANGTLTVQLGTAWYSSTRLSLITKVIDEWIDLKRN